MSILCFILILNARIQIGNRISLFLGEVSFEVYLIHGYVFEIIEQLFPHVPSGVYILSSLLLTVLFAAIIHYVSGKLLKKLHSWCPKLVA